MDVDPEPDDKAKPAEKDWKAEADKWKALARKHESTAKANKSAADELAQIKDAQKTAEEKLAAAKEAAEAKADAAIRRAVAAEIKALATADFADPTDAEGALNPRDFVDDKGDIDVDGIRAALAETLERKPHWRKQTAAPTAPKTPKPDPGQGSRGEPQAVDYRTASDDEVAAKLAAMGIRRRR